MEQTEVNKRQDIFSPKIAQGLKLIQGFKNLRLKSKNTACTYWLIVQSYLLKLKNLENAAEKLFPNGNCMKFNLCMNKTRLTSSRTLPKSGSIDLKKYLYEPDLSSNILKSFKVISPRLQ